jgi:hypothetical protein
MGFNGRGFIGEGDEAFSFIVKKGTPCTGEYQ